MYYYLDRAWRGIRAPVQVAKDMFFLLFFLLLLFCFWS